MKDKSKISGINKDSIFVNNKKAQNAGQVLIYVLAVVIFSVILIFGYKSITDFKERADVMTLIEFQKKMESSIKSISSDYGTSRKLDFSLSNEYTEVCFVRNYDVSIIDPAPFEDYPYILDTIDLSQPTKNIFLIKNKKEVAENYNMGRIRFKDESIFKCFNVTFSSLSIRMEGKGNYWGIA